ncbi:hypothetical protein GCM10010424_16440 [Streptomyces lienomycini]
MLRRWPVRVAQFLDPVLCQVRRATLVHELLECVCHHTSTVVRGTASRASSPDRPAPPIASGPFKWATPTAGGLNIEPPTTAGYLRPTREVRAAWRTSRERRYRSGC